MGKFETVVEFYRYREPYPPAFFAGLAERLVLTRRTRLLDVACGPGNLSIGFAPYVGSVTAVDREPEMLRVGIDEAAKAKVNITFIQSAVEDLSCGSSAFDLVTIGRALHWLPREATLALLERVVAPGGRITICGSTTADTGNGPWAVKFKELRKAWASDPEESRYVIDMDRWFAPSRFRRVDEIAVDHRHWVTVSDLVCRALSFSITSPAVLGDRRPQFEAEMRAALEPFAEEGTIEEDVVAKATVFG